MDEKGEKISVDLGEMKKFFKKYGMILLILIPIFLSIWFRAYTYSLPITDEWAQNSVYSSIKSQIRDNIESQYPDLLEQNKEVLIEKEFQKTITENRAYVDQQIIQMSEYIKSKLQDNRSKTYLPDIDSYMWYRQADNYLKYGYMGTEKVNGTLIERLRNGRVGKAVEFSLDPFFIAMIFKTVSPFNDNFNLMDAAFVLPIILIALSVIAAFFIGRRIAGNMGGFFAGVMIAINSALLSRTSGGFCDTDAFQAFFPLFILWFFVEAVHSNGTTKKAVLSCVTGASIGLYGLAWKGWWYIFDLIIASLVAYAVFQIIANRKEIKKGFFKFASENSEMKNNLIMIALIALFSCITITLFFGFNSFLKGPLEPLAFMNMKEVVTKSLWPNVLTTVAEFGEASMSEIISSMGGNLLFFTSLMGIILLLFNEKKKGCMKNMTYLVMSALFYMILLYFKESIKDAHTLAVMLSLPMIVGIIKVIYLKEDKEVGIKMPVILMLWFIASSYAYSQGVRFNLILVPGFAISFGVALSKIYYHAKELSVKKFNLNPMISGIVIAVLLCSLFVSSIKTADTIAKNELPMVNDEWVDSMNEIKSHSEDAIITSWWDFGHWFVALSERRVTFDGGDQGRRIYWVGKTLSTKSEKEAVGILRMLNCQQDKAYLKLYEYTGDEIRAINIINTIVALSKSEAETVLRENLETEEQVQEILDLTFCDNLIDQIYIVSEDMVQKAGVWSHFGLWDFRKAKMYQEVKGKSQEEGMKILKEEFGKTENDAFDLYYQIQNNDADQWISGWFGYKSDVSECSSKEDMILCENGLLFNMTSNDATILTQDGYMHPKSIVYPTDEGAKEGLYEREYEENALPFSAVLIKKEVGGFQSIYADPELANSMFTKLFYEKGRGLNNFKLVSEKTQFNGEKIYIYQVNF